MIIYFLKCHKKPKKIKIDYNYNLFYQTKLNSHRKKSKNLTIICIFES